MDKSPKEQKVEKEIEQLQNRQKILLNRKRTEEHRARTHRLIGRGAISGGCLSRCRGDGGRGSQNVSDCTFPSARGAGADEKNA